MIDSGADLKLEAGVFIDEGLPLPQSYGVDIIRALLQNPHSIYVYWEISQQSLDHLMASLRPDERSEFRVTLRLIEHKEGREVFFDVARQGNYWMSVYPEREYVFELGLRRAAREFIPLVRSNRVHTPRGTVAPESGIDG